MIALTKEKREALINRCRKFTSINAQRGFIGVAEEECDLIHQIALAALKAGTVFQIQKESYNNKVWIDTESVEEATANKCHGYEYRTLFTAPPVPEIKLPKKLHVGEIYHELTEKYGMDVSVDQLEIGLAEEVYSIAVNTFERLNGLGSEMKTVFAFGYEINVEDWVKYIAVDLDGEIWGFNLKPELDSDGIWSVGGADMNIYLGEINQPLTENKLLIIGV